MIKFFRKIRQHLLRNGNISDYIKYASGEIVLVVIGILIALQINNWNESRKLQEAEQAFITGIKSDLQKDVKFINFVLTEAKRKDSVFQIITNNLHELYNYERPRLDTLLQKLFVSQRTFYPVSGTFQSAISANEFKGYKNKDFISRVFKLYNSTYTRLMDNAQNTDERWYYVVRKYSRIRRLGKIYDMSETELDVFLDDLFYHIYGLNYYTGNLESALDNITYLINFE